MSTKPPERSPESLIRALSPIVVALVGSGGLIVFARADAPTRLQIGAEILFWVCLSALALAIVAALYPIAIERQVAWTRANALSWRTRRNERRFFREWVKHWRDLTALILENLQNDRTVRDWLADQGRYDAVRGWLIQHDDPSLRSAATFVHRHLTAQFGTVSLVDDKMKTSFFVWYRSLELDELLIWLIREGKSGYYGEPSGHTVSQSYQGIWDGLVRYGHSRGWGDIGTIGWPPTTGEVDKVTVS